MTTKSPLPLFEEYADKVQKKFAASVAADFNDEDQLKTPLSGLIEALGPILISRQIVTVTEIHASEISGRPDIGVITDSLLTGHIELKAPGKGARPEKFKGDNHKQWEKFKNLPNLIYTDGSEWALYRTGERLGKVVRFSGNVADDGKSAITQHNADALAALIQDFLLWTPVVPKNPTSLAKLLAPLCRLLKQNVLESLEDAGSNMSDLSSDWKRYLFPDADNAQFADAYAQTLTYALLLARFSGTNGEFSISTATSSLKKGHRLLSDALKILSDEKAKQEIAAPIGLLERVISTIDPKLLFGEEDSDPWLYFYEDFLAEYDPDMRKDRGVYYTPVEVVKAQICLVDELLKRRFKVANSFVDPKVITLDPAVGTGTYIATALRHGLKKIERARGRGMRSNAASQAASNIYAFEILVGPYAVAHLRLTQQILAEDGTLPDEGVHVYLTDTLESPNLPPPEFPMLYKELGIEHERARKVKVEVPVLVCIGNPPYDRQQRDEETKATTKLKGGWVRFGDVPTGEASNETRGILKDFIDPLESLGYGVHAKNLYNDYVYFWRWALWKVFNTDKSQGIVSFITASSYLYGPGFAGMRKVMRSTFNDLWIIDLGGDNLGARKSENIFAIQTPVAIAIGVKNKDKKDTVPATVHYARIDGKQDEKLNALDGLRHFNDLEWRECLAGWTDPFLPTSDNPYWDWPLVTDLFPWQENGMQFKRTWPIAETKDVLIERWKKLLNATTKEQKRKLLRETAARKVDKAYYPINDNSERQKALSDLKETASKLFPVRYAYRSFDRQWMILDSRLCDRPRPALQKAHGDKQIYLTSLLTKVLGEGPSATATHLIPDLDHFSGRGAKDVIPLWRDKDAKDANITKGVLDVLVRQFRSTVLPEDLFAYCYAILSTPDYVTRLWDELTIPGPRLPIPKNKAMFEEGVNLGRQLLWLHTYGERFIPHRKQSGKLPKGKAKCKKGTSSNPQEYPDSFAYDRTKQELQIGNSGVFTNVRNEVWDYNISGLEVVNSWLSYRMKSGSGKTSSDLDKIRPKAWMFDEELLDLLWVLDATIDLIPIQGKFIKRIFKSKLFNSQDFPIPSSIEKDGPNGGNTPLFDGHSKIVDEEDAD